jgi:anti-anti-sigma regulatory factor
MFYHRGRGKGPGCVMGGSAMASGFVIERDGLKVRVVLGAELVAPVVPELRELLCAIQDDGVTNLQLDFSSTSQLDAAGLSLLLAARNSFSVPPKTLKLLNVQPPVLSWLQTLRLDQRLNVNTR